jgi:hypothetical protein
MSKRFASDRPDLPYGKWTCADGREVLFNRMYKPIWQRFNGVTTPANPAEWVKFTQQDWFYNDSTARQRGMIPKLETILREFGV